jgi:hypothetical protein
MPVAQSPGLVEPGCVYTLDEIKSRMKLGTAALRAARRAGLKVRYIGRRGYVMGSDIIRFIEQSDA